MLFSKDWLSQYVDLPADDQELARKLTFAGLAVEHMEECDGDLVLDLDVTTNRPDCMNHYGVAREIAVLFDRPLKPPAHLEDNDSAPDVGQLASITLNDERCPRYAAKLIRGVTVGPSPDWLRRRLEAIGSRSINNVVDVTNYVLWELGQPLHAFDLAKLAGRTIDVRPAKPGEELVTLDGERRKLDPEIMVIADAERAVALAGIMGGRDSEVTETTTEILLESAHFDPRAVRRAARQLAMHTDACHRFERGADPEICAAAATRVAHLIAELAGGTVVPGVLDELGDRERSWRLEGRLEMARLQRFMGVEVECSIVERWLSGLGFELIPVGEDVWTVRVPGWRYYDFENRKPTGAVYEADLFEEVIRLHGFANIPSTVPKLAGIDASPSPLQEARRRAQDHLAACGFVETINFAFHSPQQAVSYPAMGAVGEEQTTDDLATVQLANALSERYSTLRPSLLPGLVESAQFNQRRNAARISLFEVGNTFLPSGEELPRETEAIALVQGGLATQGSAWEPRGEVDYFDLKGVVESLVSALLPGATIGSSEAVLPGFSEGATAQLRLLPVAGAAAEGEAEGELLGHLGQLEVEGPYPLYAAELRLGALVKERRVARVEIPSRYPNVEVDLTLTHALTVTWRQLAARIEAAPPADLKGFELKDRYRGKGVPAGAVNTTISFSYNAEGRSLTHEEVNERHLVLIRQMEKSFGIDGEA